MRLQPATAHIIAVLGDDGYATRYVIPLTSGYLVVPASLDPADAALMSADEAAASLGNGAAFELAVLSGSHPFSPVLIPTEANKRRIARQLVQAADALGQLTPPDKDTVHSHLASLEKCDPNEHLAYIRALTLVHNGPELPDLDHDPSF